MNWKYFRRGGQELIESISQHLFEMTEETSKTLMIDNVPAEVRTELLRIYTHKIQEKSV
jgi:hypothetical protein